MSVARVVCTRDVGCVRELAMDRHTHTRTHPPTHTHTQVIFVTSAERPVTETEGKLLGYIKEWGKKVVMVLNKVRLNVFSLDCLL